MTLQHRTIESKETFIEGLKEIKAKFKQFGSYEVDLTDDQLKAELFDFQVIGLKWLLFLFYNNWNGILADEMVNLCIALG
jgi:SNF2 family DNA or RNA helicase